VIYRRFEEDEMAEYLVQAAYTPEALEAMIENPQNRFEAVKPALESIGGTLKQAWFAFGEADIILIVDVPNIVDAVAFSIATASKGALKSIKTTPLISVEQSVEAMGRAQQVKYVPPTRTPAGVR